MEQSAAVFGNDNTVLQINGDENSIDFGGLRLSFGLPGAGIGRSSDTTDFLRMFYPGSRSTAFIGRDREQRLINDFLDAAVPLSFMTVSGDAGSGKTRLALEICLARREQGWEAGFLSSRSLENLARHCGAFTAWSCSRPTLIVVDYAGSLAQPLHDVLFWLSEKSLSDVRLRFLLLERTAGDDVGWLDTLRGKGGERSLQIRSLQYGEGCVLSSLPDRKSKLALMQHLLQSLGMHDDTWQQDDGFVQRLLNAAWGGLPLFLMLAAYTMVYRRERVATWKREDLAKEFAGKEVARISERVSGQELDTDFLLELAACVTLAQGSDAEDFRTWVSDIFQEYASSGHPRKYIQALREVLSGELQAGEERLQPVRPDIIGEAFILKVLGKEKGLVLACLQRFGDPVLDTLLRLAHDFGSRDKEPLYWLDAVLKSYSQPKELEALDKRRPYPSLPLRKFALDVTEKRLQLWQQHCKSEDSASRREYAAIQWNRSVALHEMGHSAQALEAARDVAEIYRTLCKDDSATLRPVLAASLNNLANMLSDSGQHDESLKTAQEAVSLWQELAAENSAIFRADLAKGLNTLGNRLSDVGQHEEALEKAQEAVRLWQELAAGNPSVFRADLAQGLNNLSVMLRERGQNDEALENVQEAVGLLRELAAENPSVSRVDLARSLTNLATILREFGQYEEALEKNQEAVSLLRELAAENLSVCRVDLAKSLNNLANMLNDVGQHEEALKKAQEAVGLLRDLASESPSVFRADLATCLNNLGNRLSNFGRHEDALEKAQEAVSLWQELAAENPLVFRANLAKGLNNLGNRLSEVGRHEEALEKVQEAVRLRRELAAKNSSVFRADLAKGLNNLGNRLSEVGRHEEALEKVQEAVRLWRELAAKNSSVFRADLAKGLNTLGNRLSEAGRHDEALEKVQEAVRLWRELADEKPSVFRADFAVNLSFLVAMLGERGQYAEVVKLAQETIGTLREESVRHPQAFLPLYEKVLSLLSYCLQAEGKDSTGVEAELQRVLEALKKGSGL